MPLPANPTNGQTATLRGITYTYNATSGSWSIATLYSNTAAFTTLNGNLQAPSAIFTGTDAIKVPVGNTAQRPTAATGQLRFNSNLGVFEGYNGTIWGSIGGGAKIQDTAPSNPIAGDLWWKSDEGQLYVYYSDGTSDQWVIASSFAGSGGYLPITGGNVTGTIAVTGNISVSGNSNLTTINSGLMQNGNSNVAITANSTVSISSNGAVRATFAANGNVGIGNATPAHRLSINGNLFTSAVSTNYQVSNATATTVNTTTPTTIASVTITTVGKPVLLVASGDMNPQTGNDWNVIAFYRDSTQVGKIIIAQGGGTSFNNPWALTHIDVPAAGTYTYTVKAYQGTGTTLYGETGAGQAPTLVAMELI